MRYLWFIPAPATRIPSRYSSRPVSVTAQPAHPLSGFPVSPGSIPSVGSTDGPYELAFARTKAELKEIQRLRYAVFNLELDEGLEASHASGLDEDAYDTQCHHLYVRHRESGRIVGTYRMQTRDMAEDHLGFYSNTLFDLSAIPDDVLGASLEIGRACIAQEHRGLHVLYLLWKGLGLYAAHNTKQFLFGCCSLTSQDEAEGRAVYRFLSEKGHLDAEWDVLPQPGFACSMDAAETGDLQRPPRLMRAYLSLGARICGRPAIDREFKTIDFLALFDFQTLQKRDLAFYRFTT